MAIKLRSERCQIHSLPPTTCTTAEGGRATMSAVWDSKKSPAVSGGALGASNRAIPVGFGFVAGLGAGCVHGGRCALKTDGK